MTAMKHIGLACCLLFSYTAFSQRHDLVSSFDEYQRASAMVLNVSSRYMGSLGDVMPKAHFQFGAEKNGLTFTRFKVTCMQEAAGQYYTTEALYTDTTLYSYDFVDGFYRDKGSVYGWHQGKRLLRTEAYLIDSLFNCFKRMVNDNSHVIMTQSGNDFIYTLPATNTTSEIRLSFHTGDVVPFEAALFINPGDERNYILITINQADLNPSFNRYFFKTPNLTGSDKQPLAIKKETKRTTSAQSSQVETLQKALLKQGTAAPQWTLSDLNGNRRSLSEFKGKWVILDFWATWCAPCLASMPNLQELQNKYDSTLVVIGMDQWEKSKTNIQEFLSKRTITYLIIRSSDENAASYHVSSLPTVYLIDPAGTIRFSYVGFDIKKENEMMMILKKEIH